MGISTLILRSADLKFFFIWSLFWTGQFFYLFIYLFIYDVNMALCLVATFYSSIWISWLKTLRTFFFTYIIISVSLRPILWRKNFYPSNHRLRLTPNFLFFVETDTLTILVLPYFYEERRSKVYQEITEPYSYSPYQQRKKMHLLLSLISFGKRRSFKISLIS